MLGTALVDEQITDGRRLLERFVADGNPVRAAFWGTVSDEDPWYLYVVTDLVNGHGVSQAYTQLRQSLEKLGPSPGVSDGFVVKLISPEDRRAKGAISALASISFFHVDRVTGQLASKLGMWDCYLYPEKYYKSPDGHSMTTDDVGRELVRIMQLIPSPSDMPHIALKNGRSFNGIPLSIQRDLTNKVTVHFQADSDPQSLAVALEDIASIA
jgi:hypothetical protein